jgi:hypothetical protein
MKHFMFKLVRFLFPSTVNEIVQDTLTEALHPDFGWYWKEEEQGGKYLAQARAQGWRDCFDEILAGKRREKE